MSDDQELSVLRVPWQVEQRYRAVLEVQHGAGVREVAARYGASRQSVYNWKLRFEQGGLAGLQDGSRRPLTSPQRMPAEVESLVCQLRRTHPRWGARRLVFELGQRGVDSVPVAATIHRALVRNGLVERQHQRHKRKYRRWQRETPMQLWQMDLVGGLYLAGGRECKILTGIDDHSRYVVIAAVLAVPNGRAVCEAFLAAIGSYGVPAEVLTDNGKQFTGRFTRPRPAEVLFERVCREHGITARLTRPRSPTTTGKIERFHQTLRRELLDNLGPLPDLSAAQAALDEWVHSYNYLRPHQAIGMNCPATLFRPIPTPPARAGFSGESSESLAAGVDISTNATLPQGVTGLAVPAGLSVTLDKRIPASGSFAIAPNAQQVWLGPAWAGRIVTVWADERSIHLLADGNLIKTVPSRITPRQLNDALMRGARPGGPQPAAPALPTVDGALTLAPGQAIEIERSVVRDGILTVNNRTYKISGDLVGRRVTLRLDGHLMHAIADHYLVGTWPCPVPHAGLAELRGARLAAGPLPDVRPSGAIQVQRRVPTDGVTMVARQRLRIGRLHAGKVVTILVEDTHFRVLHDDEELSIHARHQERRPIRITAYNRQNSGAQPKMSHER